MWQVQGEGGIGEVKRDWSGREKRQKEAGGETRGQGDTEQYICWAGEVPSKLAGPEIKVWL